MIGVGRMGSRKHHTAETCLPSTVGADCRVGLTGRQDSFGRITGKLEVETAGQRAATMSPAAQPRPRPRHLLLEQKQSAANSSDQVEL